ncbi:uncharacterized protein LOC121413593 isoform X2 [Lytechinus variegatus]|uniref:uncharacterized protein LOC121413593 isoform X2 n=1 Tax=Lytechinus variegatus TaxID=7654 RepID=UPI001BB119FB|nr:uncharacterized protein LOC121413593 isoform X2 [Lytechinus variegatus]
MDQTAFVPHLGRVIKFELLSGHSQPNRDSDKSLFSDDSIFSGSDAQAIQLQVVSFGFSSENRSFEEETRSKACALQNADGRIVSAQCLRESHTGVVLPCVIIQSQTLHEDYVCSLFFYVPSSNKLCLYGEFSTKFALPRNSVYLADGPVVCWRVVERNEFLIARTEVGSRSFTVHRFIDVNDAKESSIMHCSANPDGSLHLITTPQIEVDGGSEERIWKRAIWQSEKSFNFANSSCLVPEVYASITCCMLYEEGNTSSGESENVGDYNPSLQWNTTYIATSMKQLLKFQNGVFCKLTSIPFDDAVDIVTMETRGEKVLIVRSRRSQVCVISCTSFQVIEEWKNVMCVCIDDVIGNGRDQLLMLLHANEGSPEEQPFPQFILTDLDLCHITRCDPALHDGKGQRSDVRQSTSSPESLITAMKALEAKVEIGLTSLKEQELSRRLKDSIITQSMENLAQMANGVSISSPGQATLVHLCGVVASQPSQCPEPRRDTGQRLNVTNGWHRIVNGKWVIGVKVTNDTPWAVSDMKLLVLPWKTDLFQELDGCEGSIYHPVSHITSEDCPETEFQESSSGPPNKRTKLQDMTEPSVKAHGTTSSSSSGDSSSPALPLMPGNECDAVAMMSIPTFLEGSVVFRLLILQWMSFRPGERIGLDRPRVMSRICGRVSVTAADVLGTKLSVKLPEVDPTLAKPLPLHQSQTKMLSRTDRLAMDASQLSITVQVTSRYTPLQNLPRVLSKDLGFQEMRGENTCLCDCTSGVLRGTRVYVDGIRNHSVLLTVCARDKRELMLFFHTLKSSLPVDIQFNLDTPSEQIEEAIQNGIRSMNKELQHVQKTIDLACSTIDAGMNHTEKNTEGSKVDKMEIGGGGDSNSGEQERVKRLREDFLTQQAYTKSKDCELRGEQAESLRFKLLELRETTDAAVTTLSRCIR